jgi:hypothetical protein
MTPTARLSPFIPNLAFGDLGKILVEDTEAEDNSVPRRSVVTPTLNALLQLKITKQTSILGDL